MFKYRNKELYYLVLCWVTVCGRINHLSM